MTIMSWNFQTCCNVQRIFYGAFQEILRKESRDFKSHNKDLIA